MEELLIPSGRRGEAWVLMSGTDAQERRRGGSETLKIPGNNPGPQ